MKKRLFGEVDNSEIAASLNNIALSYKKMKNYEKALEINLEALNMEKRLFGE